MIVARLKINLKQNNVSFFQTKIYCRVRTSAVRCLALSLAHVKEVLFCQASVIRLYDDSRLALTDRERNDDVD